MSLGGKTPIYLFVDSGFRNRLQWPYPTEFDAKFVGGGKTYSKETPDMDLILYGASLGEGNIGGYDIKNPWDYPPVWYNGFKYMRGKIAFGLDAKENSSIVLYIEKIYEPPDILPPDGIYDPVTDEVSTTRLVNGWLNGLYIEVYDNVNPTVSYTRKILNFEGQNSDGTPVNPDYFYVEIDSPIPDSVVDKLFSIRYFGPPRVHGTLTAATQNTATLFGGPMVSSKENFYVDNYLLIVDTDTTNGSGRYENVNRMYKITSYNPQTLTVNLQQNFVAIPSVGSRYEILSVLRHNEGHLSYRGSLGATASQYRNYDISLVQLSIPSGAIGVVSNSNHSDIYYNRGDLREFPYLFLEVSNLSGGHGQNAIFSNSMYMANAVFAIFVREDENSTATRALLYSGETHVISFKLTDTLKISLKTTNGELLQYLYLDVRTDSVLRDHNGIIMQDRQAPYPPDPNLQVSMMFSLVPR